MWPPGFGFPHDGKVVNIRHRRAPSAMKQSQLVHDAEIIVVSGNVDFPDPK